MTGERGEELSHNSNGWTVYTLKAYADQRFEDGDKAVQAALMSQKEAVLKAESATDKRFETVRVEADFRMNALANKIDELQASMNQNLGRSGPADRDEERAYARAVQSHYLGNYAVIGVALAIVAGVVGYLFR
jgi:hypothetical protein